MYDRSNIDRRPSKCKAYLGEGEKYVVEKFLIKKLSIFLVKKVIYERGELKRRE